MCYRSLTTREQNRYPSLDNMAFILLRIRRATHKRHCAMYELLVLTCDFKFARTARSTEYVINQLVGWNPIDHFVYFLLKGHIKKLRNAETVVGVGNTLSSLDKYLEVFRDTPGQILVWREFTWYSFFISGWDQPDLVCIQPCRKKAICDCISLLKYIEWTTLYTANKTKPNCGPTNNDEGHSVLGRFGSLTKKWACFGKLFPE